MDANSEPVRSGQETDMNEQAPEETTSADISRRKMLQRSAFVVGAAAVWSTPVVKSLGMRPAAATNGTPDQDSDFCPDLDDPGQPDDLVYRYEPRRCSSIQSGDNHQIEDGDYECSSSPDDCLPVGKACIRVHRTGGPDSGTTYYLVDEEETFLVAGRAGARQDITITTCGCVQEVTLHTSCSQPLDIGEKFGSLTLVGGQAGDFPHAGVQPGDVDSQAEDGSCDVSDLDC